MFTSSCASLMSRPVCGFRLFAPALVVLFSGLFSACGPAQSSGERAVAPPDTLPFVFASEPVIEVDPSEAAKRARETEASLEASAAPGLVLSMYATEDLIEDPVAIDVANTGEMLVTRSSRTMGLLDIRQHPDWRLDALAMKTTHDFEAFMREVMAPELSDENAWIPDLNEDGSRDWRDLTVVKERLHRIEDTDGDGVADRAHTVVAGFNTLVSDILGGLLVHEKDIYLSAAPGVYRLEDVLGNAAPDASDVTTLSWGYNVHPGFSGHGVSGITVGPEGRIYWGVGDMGLSLVSKEGEAIHYPHQGAILRAFPDGSGLELFARGLRNTHEFAFDAHGNLISVDNDGDHPNESERLVYLVEGSDSGWRTHWQFGKYHEETNNPYKPWMDEGLYLPHFEGQAAFITPPIMNYHDGPTGIVYNPGTALNEAWNGRFFMSEYTGSAFTSDIHAFRLAPRGAGFELAEEDVAVKSVLGVGLAFGPDGALYFADWIDGWRTKGAGRVWKLDAAEPDEAVRSEVRTQLAADFGEVEADALYDLLHSPDMRVRQKAQFELARRGDAETFLRAVRQTETAYARIHGVWGIWQLALRDAAQAAPLVALLEDADPEMRAQAARVLGDVRYAAAGEALAPLLVDDSDRVRFFAAEALGRIAYRPALDGLVTMLAEAGGEDVYLRHVGSLALGRLGDAEALMALTGHASEAVRMGAVLALRRMQHEGVSAFLADADEFVVTEAARAINDDGGIPEALPSLAALLDVTSFENEPLLRRAISANLRVGGDADATRLAAYAARADAPAAMRAEAIAALGVWAEPSTLDRVDGAYLGPVHRAGTAAQEAVAPLAEILLADEEAAVREAAAGAVARLHIDGAGAHLADRLRLDDSEEVRAAALQALLNIPEADHAGAVRQALADESADVRMLALELVTETDLSNDEVASVLGEALRQGSVPEQQSALTTLSGLPSPQTTEVLGELLDRLENGEAAAEIHLDILEAVEAAGSDVLKTRAEAWRAANPPFAAALYGGNRRRGVRIFLENSAGECTRCHRLNGEDGVGPSLLGIGSRLDRMQLLESLVDPAARIAPGFGTEGGPSAMPDMSVLLSEREIRDLVEFMASIRGSGRTRGDGG